MKVDLQRVSDTFLNNINYLEIMKWRFTFLQKLVFLSSHFSV